MVLFLYNQSCTKEDPYVPVHSIDLFYLVQNLCRNEKRIKTYGDHELERMKYWSEKFQAIVFRTQTYGMLNHFMNNTDSTVPNVNTIDVRRPNFSSQLSTYFKIKRLILHSNIPYNFPPVLSGSLLH